MYVPFNELAPESRLWIYQANRFFTESEREIILSEVKAFCEEWLAHGHPLKTSFKIEHNLFLILAVDENVSGASGCSIDGSVRMLKEFHLKQGIDFLDRSNVAFLKNDKVQLYKMSELKGLFNEGILSRESLSFNNALTSKIDFERKWITRAGDCWLTKYVPKKELA